MFYRKMNLTVPRVFRRTVDRCPDRTALIFEDRRWTFLDLEDYSNRVAHFFLGLGYKPGDCIALFMENRPEYVGIWLGCAKIGVVPALINSNLTGKPLLHSINAASAIACVYGTEVAESKFKVVRRIMGLYRFDRYFEDAEPLPLVTSPHLKFKSSNMSLT